jgi:hypothetical protein
LIPKGHLDAALIMMCKPGVKLLEKQEFKPSFDNPDEVIALNLNWSSANIQVKLVAMGMVK